MTYSTSRSRLNWTKVFGNDCTLTKDPETECTGLPAQEFDYTDIRPDLGTGPGVQYEDTEASDPSAPYAYYGGPLESSPYATYQWSRNFADLNGDGMMDWLLDGLVYLNSGTDYVTADPYGTGLAFEAHLWQEALENLQYEHPRMEVTQVLVDDTSGNVVRQAFCAAQYYEDTLNLYGPAAMSEDSPKRADRPQGMVSRDLGFTGSATGTTADSATDVSVKGRPFYQDLNGDGFPEVILSVRLSGTYLNADCSGNLLGDPSDQNYAAPYVEGKTVSVVFRHTGDISTGWVRDDSLAQGLPPIGELAFESYYYTEHQMEFANSTGFPCEDRGLNGDLINWKTDVCHNLISYAPHFVDLDGDGHLDILALDRHDMDIPGYGGNGHRAMWVWGAGEGVAAWNQTVLWTHAWLQKPKAGPGEDRWVRATEFDLPERWTIDGNYRWGHVMEQTDGDQAYTTIPENYPFVRSYDQGTRIADLNRDGLTDVVWKLSMNGHPGDEGVFINMGRGDGTASSAWCGSTTELANLASGETCAWASSYIPPGLGFASRVAFWTIDVWNPVGSLGDLNGDGWLDYLFLDPYFSFHSPSEAWLGGPSGYVKDDRFAPLEASEVCNLNPGCLGSSAQFQRHTIMVDANGDGSLDVLGQDFARISISRHADLLSEVRNGQGGTVRIAYEPMAWGRDSSAGGLEEVAESHAAAHGEALGTALEDVARWTSSPVVTSVSIEGPNVGDLSQGGAPGPVAPTTYRYAQPRYCTESRTDLGFRLVERTRPDQSVVEQAFYQHHGRAGKTSRIRVFDGAQLIHTYFETWDLPDFTGGAPPGVLDHPEVHVGRLHEAYSVNVYTGGAEGASRSRTLTYDDVYGYNFVSRVDVTRPTGDLAAVAVPQASNLSDWIIGLSAERRKEDGVGNVISRSTFVYTGEGAIDSRTDYERDRGAAGSGDPLLTDFTYDTFGNVKSVTDPALRTTHYCYDGPAGQYDVGCPSFAGLPETASVRTGVIDPMGKLTSLQPDPGSGRILVVDSAYDDEPRATTVYDPFGRVMERWVTPLGGSPVLASKSFYGDVEPPHIETDTYTGSDVIRSAVVSDGFGGTWKAIEETPTGYMGTLTYRDPANRLVRQTYPIDCAPSGSNPPDNGAFCDLYDGADEALATETTTDALGRPIEVVTPDGISRTRYSGVARTQPAGPATTDSFDVVLSSNGKGDLVERWMDGDRVAWVDECPNGVAPGDPIATATCGAADQTFYTYEPDGVISTIYDAVATSTSSFADPNHYLRYHYDTLARVVQIDDPDGGSSSTQYADSGNVSATTNARGQTTLYGYDDLDRLTLVLPATNGDSVEVTYRPNERQRATTSSPVVGPSYTLSYDYDDFGRLERKTHQGHGSNGFALLMDFDYDLLGRTTQIVYPDDATVVNYVYEGAYLDQVCEVDDPVTTGCETPIASFVSEVTYDDLGRRTAVAMQPGTRSYDYSLTTQRLTKDRFDGGSGYWVERDYGVAHAGYDEIGNLVDVRGGSSIGGDPVVEATYGYDRRNRLSWWERSSTTEHYGYDSLGNLTNYATADAGSTHANQVFGEAGGARPHAVTSSTASGTSVAFAYDGDGNMASATGGSGGDRHYRFDWANRLVGVGPTAGSSATLAVAYDVDGARLSDLRGSVQRVYFDEHVTLTRSDVWSSGFDQIEFHVFAFGETVGYKLQDPVTLRTAGAGGIGFRLPPGPWRPWAAALLLGLAAGGLGVAFVRLGLHVPVARHPAAATASWVLVLLIALPPLPANTGGGGGTTARRWLVTDHLGSGVVWLDAAGTRQMHREFAPFGKVHAEASLTTGPPTIYAGHHREEASGLDYMQARWYDAGCGVFMSVDPLVPALSDPQAYAAFAYARNNPVRFVDPTGRAQVESFGLSPAGARYANTRHALDQAAYNSVHTRIGGAEPGIPDYDPVLSRHVHGERAATREPFTDAEVEGSQGQQSFGDIPEDFQDHVDGARQMGQKLRDSSIRRGAFDGTRELEPQTVYSKLRSNGSIDRPVPDKFAQLLFGDRDYNVVALGTGEAANSTSGPIAPRSYFNTSAALSVERGRTTPFVWVGPGGNIVLLGQANQYVDSRFCVTLSGAGGC
ncbi:MAG: RHS repeat-associated core domain-containing protein [Myxococcota bacterium]